MLLTLAEARDQLSGATGGDDARLTRAIEAAGQLVASYLGYPASSDGLVTAEEATYTVRCDGVTGDVPLPGTACGRWLRLPVQPLVSITSIYDDPDRDFPATTLVSSADYSIDDGNTATVKLSTTATHGNWNTGRANIKATVVAGYSQPPAWLKAAARIVVRSLLDSPTTQGRSNLTRGGENITLRDGHIIPEEARVILDANRLPITFGLGL